MLTLNSQKKLPDFLACPVVNEELLLQKNSEFILVVVSGAGCGYCARALNYLLDLDTLSNLEIIIYDFDKLESIENFHGKYFENFTFIQAEHCSAYKKNLLLPTFFLYKDLKLVWKYKGQGKSKSNIKEIKSIVKG
jgi:hypothetical protein